MRGMRDKGLPDGGGGHHAPDSEVCSAEGHHDVWGEGVWKTEGSGLSISEGSSCLTLLDP